MPSDRRVLRALELLAEPIERYRAALAATLEEVRGQVDAALSDADSRARLLRSQFGAFGTRIDTGRLASVLAEGSPVDLLDVERLERARDVLRNLASRGESLFELEVPPGGDLAALVRDQLATIGRGFAAARIVRAVIHGHGSGVDEARALDGFPFADWTSPERQLAPPLVVRVNGLDLVGGALAPFMDGAVRLLLLVDGFCPPAPLVRLVTPGTLVIQAHDFSELQPLGSAAGPAIGALVPLWVVHFTHDPGAGPQPWQRISVRHSREWRIKRIGPFSPEQQQEELAQLEALARRPEAVSEPTAPAAVPDEPVAADVPDRRADPTADVDRLAAWLLAQSDLSTVD